MISTASLRWSSRLLNLLCLTIHIYNGTSILITKGLVNMFAITGFDDIEVLFPDISLLLERKYRSLCQGFRYNRGSSITEVEDFDCC